MADLSRKSVMALLSGTGVLEGWVFHSPQKLEDGFAVPQPRLFTDDHAGQGAARFDSDGCALVAGREGLLCHEPVMRAVCEFDFDGHEGDGQTSRTYAKARCAGLRRRNLEGHEVRTVVDADLPQDFEQTNQRGLCRAK